MENIYRGNADAKTAVQTALFPDAAGRPLQILVTNDDGVDSPYLDALAVYASRFGNVTVVAPETQQSGAARSLNLHTPFTVRRMHGREYDCYAVGSTPTDCVRFALSSSGLNLKPDIVLSGINRGYNVGSDIGYSATCGAVLEAAVNGIAGIAVSTGTRGYEHALDCLDAVRTYFSRYGLFRFGLTFNVNIPDSPPFEGIVPARLGGPTFLDDYPPAGDGLVAVSGTPLDPGSEDVSIDTVAIRKGYVCVTPLTASPLDAGCLDRLRREVGN